MADQDVTRMNRTMSQDIDSHEEGVIAISDDNSIHTYSTILEFATSDYHVKTIVLITSNDDLRHTFLVEYAYGVAGSIVSGFDWNRSEIYSELVAKGERLADSGYSRSSSISSTDFPRWGSTMEVDPSLVREIASMVISMYR